MTKRKLSNLLKNKSTFPTILHWIFLLTMLAGFFFIFRDSLPGQVEEHSTVPKSGIDTEGGIFNKKTITSQAQLTPTKMDSLGSCVVDATVKYHYHANIVITIFGQKYPLTQYIGNQNGCLHPIQVHDGTSGDIHIHSLRAYPYTLGDFFTTWGFIFNSKQFGSIFIIPPYKMTMKVNGKTKTDYEKYVLKDMDQITISIEKK